MNTGPKVIQKEKRKKDAVINFLTTGIRRIFKMILALNKVVDLCSIAVTRDHARMQVKTKKIGVFLARLG